MAKTVSEILTEVTQDICDHYCKYPCMPIPDGKDENWLLEDDDSPCKECPLNKL